MSTPFLTDLDERARVKGSRDPLGYMSTWAGFGHRIIGNLTTQTVSVRGFTTLLLGFWFAERVRARSGAEAPGTLDVFIRFEQLAAYCRFHLNHDHSDFRGVRRVAAQLQRGTRVTLGTAGEHQILSSQRLYGLWGMYTGSARVSGFLEAEPLLTEAGRGLVETEYIPDLRRAGSNLEDQLIRLLAREGATIELEGRHATLARAIARLLRPSFATHERAVYTERLVNGSHLDRTNGLQQRLADQLRRLPHDTPFSIAELKAVIAAARRDGDEELAGELDRIRRLEHDLAPSAYLFSFMLTRDRQPIDRIATEVQAAWVNAARLLSIEDVRELHSHLEAVTNDRTTADRIVAIGEALVRADYADLLRLLLAQNEATMQARGGSQPWAVIENGRVRVRLKDETGRLPAPDELPDLLRHPYFIPSLKMIQAELRGAP